MAPPWPSIETLIPHRLPMLLVERIVGVLNEGLVCAGRIAETSPFVRRGVAPIALGLELAVQTAALFEALGHHPSRERPRIGYLVSIRDARFRVPGLPAGRPLLAKIQAAGSAPPLTMYSVEVTREEDGSELLAATLSTYLPDPTPGVSRSI